MGEQFVRAECRQYGRREEAGREIQGIFENICYHSDLEGPHRELRLQSGLDVRDLIGRVQETDLVS